MNGIHDMGGMEGFGEVLAQDNEAFHEDWEKQIFVANRLVRTPSLNEGRSTEYMDPVDYLGWGYFGRSLHSLERKVLRHGLVTQEELENPGGGLRGHQSGRGGSPFSNQAWESRSSGRFAQVSGG